MPVNPDIKYLKALAKEWYKLPIELAWAKMQYHFYQVYKIDLLKSIKKHPEIVGCLVVEYESSLYPKMYSKGSYSKVDDEIRKLTDPHWEAEKTFCKYYERF